FPQPYPNEQAARFANGGAYPPDLSLITKRQGTMARTTCLLFLLVTMTHLLVFRFVRVCITIPTSLVVP
uniref:Uncharacterized protein n=1 Tax=Aegilops tauschii subsp. strangulata TaxID=200361 RepID=A0A453RRP7_AEGTS